MSLVCCFNMSRAMEHVVPAHQDFSGIFNKIHDVPSFDVEVLVAFHESLMP